MIADQIDRHNRRRQSTHHLGIERAILTKKWDRRFATSLIGSLFVDACVIYIHHNKAYNTSDKDIMMQGDVLEQLIHELTEPRRTKKSYSPRMHRRKRSRNKDGEGVVNDKPRDAPSHPAKRQKTETTQTTQTTRPTVNITTASRPVTGKILRGAPGQHRNMRLRCFCNREGHDRRTVHVCRLCRANGLEVGVCSNPYTQEDTKQMQILKQRLKNARSRSKKGSVTAQKNLRDFQRNARKCWEAHCNKRHTNTAKELLFGE